MSETLKDRWDAWKAPDSLDECVLLFMEILETEEIKDSGNRFRPNKITDDAKISSCRVWDTHRMGKILERMKTLAYQQQQLREMKEWNL